MNAFSLKVVRNTYYNNIRHTKRQFWRDFLQGSDETLEDSERYWMTLKYTKLGVLSTTPVLHDSEGNQATSLEDKATMVRQAAFPPPSADQVDLGVYWEGKAYHRVDKARV